MSNTKLPDTFPQGNANDILMDDEKTEISKANETVVRHSTTSDGLNMKFVSLAMPATKWFHPSSKIALRKAQSRLNS